MLFCLIMAIIMSIQVVIRESNNPRLKTFSNYRIGGENDGIVNF